MARKSDDPSVVVSMDEIQAAVAYPAPGQRPSRPAQPEDEDLPPTIAVGRPGASEDDEPPPTLPIQRPPIPQEKTMVLPTPSTSAPPMAPATAPVVAKPASNPPYKPGSGPPYKPPTPLASRSQPPRLPGPGSRAPAPRSVAPIEPLETDEVERPATGLPKAWLAGGAALLLVLLVVVGVWLGRNGNKGGDTGGGRTGGSSAPAGNGVIQVETSPSGATIKLNDEAKGTAPTALTGLAPGTYEVVAELSRHEPAFQKVTLTEGAPAPTVSLSLQPSKTAMSEADILSRPAGAAVTMDGQKIGQTPLRGYELRVGNRRFRLTTEGYEPFVEFLRVEEGKSARLDARLVPLGTSPPPPPAANTPSANPPAVNPPAAKPPSAGAAAKATSAPVPTTTLAAVAAAPSPTPAPAKPAVDTSRVYMENEVDTPPRKLSGDNPAPNARLKSGELRKVAVSFTVTETGDVADTEIVESGGKMFDEAVMSAVRKWKYAPGTQQGVKIKVSLTRRFRFETG